jgi:hypothetical protein
VDKGEHLPPNERESSCAEFIKKKIPEGERTQCHLSKVGEIGKWMLRIF